MTPQTSTQISAESFRAEADALLNSESVADSKKSEESEFQNLFKFQSANTWITESKDRPVPKMLFGELWFSGELCIFFGDTGKGKTVLAVQIGDSISGGIQIAHFTLQMAKQKVLYVDFELSAKQFEMRYSEKSIGDEESYSNHYIFDDNFIRAEIDLDVEIDTTHRTFEEYLYHSLKTAIVETDAKVLIVDNITYLKNATETAKDALPLMKELNRLKKKFDLSILVLAHTPKRNLANPISVNDLQGSKMLSNFADSIFALGESAKDGSLRYIKQLKERSTPNVYGSENVGVFEIKKDKNFLKLDFVGFGGEREHLREWTEQDRSELASKAKSLKKEGFSYRDIAEKLNISSTTVSRYLNKG